MNKGEGRSGGVVVALAVSEVRGVPKTSVNEVTFIEGWGIAGDGHAGPGPRQVSLLAAESVAAVKAQGADVGAGSFAENITIGKLDWASLGVGGVIKIKSVELVVTQRGKECHDRCEIYRQLGACKMSEEGLFAVVRRGGVVRVGDAVTVEYPESAT